MVSLASHVLHHVKSQVLNQVTSSHQVEATVSAGGINPAPEGGDAEAGPGVPSSTLLLRGAESLS